MHLYVFHEEQDGQKKELTVHSIKQNINIVVVTKTCGSKKWNTLFINYKIKLPSLQRWGGGIGLYSKENITFEINPIIE